MYLAQQPSSDYSSDDRMANVGPPLVASKIKRRLIFGGTPIAQSLRHKAHGGAKQAGKPRSQQRASLCGCCLFAHSLASLALLALFAIPQKNNFPGLPWVRNRRRADARKLRMRSANSLKQTHSMCAPFCCAQPLQIYRLIYTGTISKLAIAHCATFVRDPSATPRNGTERRVS